MKGSIHGGPTGSPYRSAGCRCTPCVQANAAYVKRRRERRIAMARRGLLSFAHNRQGFIRFGCRCAVCVQADLDYRTNRKEMADRKTAAHR